MYQGRTLSELAAELERQQATKQDFSADTRSLHFRAHPIDGTLRLGMQSIDGTPRQSFPINETARRQIGERVGVPAKYWDRMAEDAPELLAANVNHWFQSEPKTRLVRVLDGKVRAMLSDRYQRVDNIDVAQVTLPALAETQAEVISCEVTERRLYIKAINHRIRGEVTTGDIVEAGVIVTNSEIGHGAVSVAPYVNRLVCVNGMVVNDARYRRHHVGAKTEQSDATYAMLSNEAIEADDRAVVLKVRDIVRGALSQSGFDPILGKMREAATGLQAAQPAKAVELLAEAHTLSENEGESVLAHLIQGGDLSRWGYVNAITRTAQDAGDYDRATELEAVGGKVMDLAPRDWEQIAVAA